MLGLVYFGAACLAARYTRFEGGVALIWVANALLFADLRYRPKYSYVARCLACAVASSIATTLYGLGVKAALPFACINIAEALGGVMLMRRFWPQPGHLASLREIGTLIGTVGVLMPALTAFAAALAAHDTAGVPYWPNWIAWFSGHALGILTVVPFLTLLLGGDVGGWARQARKAEWVEATCLFGAVVGTAIVVFAQAELPLLFLPLAPMMLAVFRLGRLGAAVSLLLLTATGTAFTVHGDGPISLIRGGPGFKVQFFQFYLVIAMLVSLPVAAELKRRKKLYSRLQQSSALYKVIADRTGDIILAVQRDGRIEYASPSIRAIGGFEPQQMAGRSARELIFEDDVDHVIERHAEAIASPDETFMVEFRARRASGELGWFESHGRATVDEDGRVTGTVNIIREVSGRKARELDLARAAGTDPLTEIPNRRSLASAYAQSVPAALEHGLPVSVAIFDLDHFKGINDRFGHDVGDLVLKRFADALRVAIRGDNVVARLGGEEFVALFIGADVEQARRICDRVRREFRTTAFQPASSCPFYVTLSAGLSGVSAAECSLDHALKAADAALYRAKAAGRDQLAVAA